MKGAFTFKLNAVKFFQSSGKLLLGFKTQIRATVLPPDTHLLILLNVKKKKKKKTSLKKLYVYTHTHIYIYN